MRTAPVPGVAAIAVVAADRRAGKATAPARRLECAGGPVSHADLPRASAGHRADIQGLRAVAVLLVVAAHAGVRFGAGGFVGVDVFFVLSGFLITGLLLGEARTHGSVSLVDFYVRRARRILPAAALTLVATDAAAFFLLNFVRARMGARAGCDDRRWGIDARAHAAGVEAHHGLDGGRRGRVLRGGVLRRHAVPRRLRARADHRHGARDRRRHGKRYASLLGRP